MGGGGSDVLVWVFLKGINPFQEVGGPRLFLYKNLSFKYLNMIAISFSFIKRFSK